MTRYDRGLLLLGAKRHDMLELWEVERYGADSFGDPDYLELFGMRPAEWYAKGLRILGRTAVECTRDALGDAIGRDVAAVVSTAPWSGPPLVVDPFAGSGNTLHWIARHLPGARALGFEADPAVFAASRRNLDRLGLQIGLLQTDHVAGLSALQVDAGRLLVAFVAPPWGQALSATAGLDLRRTDPPVHEIVDLLVSRCAGSPLLCAVQVFQDTDPASIEALTPRFAWWAMHVYDVNPPGENHGLLLAASGWTPPRTTRLPWDR